METILDKSDAVVRQRGALPEAYDHFLDAGLVQQTVLENGLRIPVEHMP